MEESSFILNIAYEWSYVGIFFLAFIANVFPGIPEEVFLLAFGYLGSTQQFNILLVGVVAFLGIMISDIIIFYLSRNGAKIYQIIAHKILGEDMEKISQNTFVQNHIRKIIFFSRFLVQLRFFGPFFAGVYKTPWKTFLFYDTLAVLVYVPGMLFIGSYFQGRVEKILSGTAVAGTYIMMIAIMIALVVILRALRKGFIRKILDTESTEKMKTFLGFSKK